MRLYLIQHAEAFSEEANPERPLTPAGLHTAQAMAAWMAPLGIHAATVWHSGKRRAEQTAQCMVPSLAPSGRVERHNGLNPKDGVKPVAKDIERIEQDMAIVGHLPQLSRLASFLLTGGEDGAVVVFQMAGIVCLERGANGAWGIRWMMTPELLNR